MAAKQTKKALKPKEYIFAVGRRKEATARVRLFNGKGESMVNQQSVSKYFPGPVNEYLLSQPFSVVDMSDKFYMTAKVVGGGLRGQAEAVQLGIARALLKAKEEFRPALKAAGLLTRDARVRERRKVGTGGKARRRKQSPKR